MSDKHRTFEEWWDRWMKLITEPPFSGQPLTDREKREHQDTWDAAVDATVAAIKDRILFIGMFCIMVASTVGAAVLFWWAVTKQ